MWSVKEHYFNMNEKQNKKLHRLPKNFPVAITKK